MKWPARRRRPTGLLISLLWRLVPSNWVHRWSQRRPIDNVHKQTHGGPLMNSAAMSWHRNNGRSTWRINYSKLSPHGDSGNITCVAGHPGN